MGYIYVIRCKLNGKCYIGRTYQADVRTRWAAHKRTGGTGEGGCRLIARALHAHGVDAFDFQIVCICFDDDLKHLEPYYIRKYGSLAPGGYNLRADNGDGTKCIVSDETRKKLRNANLGKKASTETKQKLSEAQKQRFKREPPSAETLAKRSASMRGAKHFRARAIVQLTMEGVFVKYWDCISDAQRALGKPNGNIGCCVRGETKTAYGYIWKSSNDYDAK